VSASPDRYVGRMATSVIPETLFLVL